MKTAFYFPFLACVLLLGSCNKDFSSAPVERGQARSGELRTLSFNVNAAAVTKVTGSVDAGEKAVNTTQILLFKSGGRLEAYGSSTGGASIEIECSYGQYTAKAVVNGPDCSAVASLDEFNALSVGYSDFAAGSLVMVGSSSVSTDDSGPFVIDVTRMVSRVVVRNIKRDFETTALAVKDFKIKAIYVDDVLPTVNFGSAACSASRVDHTACTALLYDSVGASIENSESHEDDHFFYVMPCFGTTALMTLVLEAELDGETMYYPITVPDLAPNTSYEIVGITLKRPGSESSDTPIEVGSLSFNVNVQPWTVIGTSTELEI
ncbi:MAG: hypothetical protein KBS55_02140 [Bacteroidales bacterium]|nr:hypothetical protein [Candidatus Cryptobacteroides aphodequi]